MERLIEDMHKLGAAMDIALEQSGGDVYFAALLLESYAQWGKPQEYWERAIRRWIAYKERQGGGE